MKEVDNMELRVKLFDDISKHEEGEIEIDKMYVYVYLYTNDNRSIKDKLNNSTIVSSIRQALFDKYGEEELDKDVSELSNQLSNYFSSDEPFYTEFTNESIIGCIKKHPELSNKHLVYDEVIELYDLKKLQELFHTYKNYYNNYYVMIPGNKYPVSIPIAYATANYMVEYATRIHEYGMSPLEKAIYIFDKTGLKPYSLENEGEHHKISSDLTQIINPNNEHICCLGYCNYENELSRILGIHGIVETLHCDNKEHNHARYMFRLIDDKYGINGVYFSDPTSKSSDKKDFKYNYSAFAQTYADIQKRYKEDWHSHIMKYFSDDIVDILRESILTNDQEEFADYLNLIQYLSVYITGEPLLKHDDSYVDLSPYEYNKIKEFIELFKRPIPAETMIKALANVRKIQAQEEENVYPYTKEALYTTYVISKWQFAGNYLTPEQELLAKLYPEEAKNKDINNFKNYINQEGIFDEAPSRVPQPLLKK